MDFKVVRIISGIPSRPFESAGAVGAVRAGSVNGGTIGSTISMSGSMAPTTGSTTSSTVSVTSSCEILEDTTKQALFGVSRTHRNHEHEESEDSDHHCDTVST